MKNAAALLKIGKQLLYIMNRKQKKDSLIVFFSMICVSCLELLGVSVIYPFLEIMLNPQQLHEEWYTKWIYELFPEIADTSVMLLMGIAIILVFLFKNAIALWFLWMQYDFSTRFQKELSTLMLDSYLKRPYEYFVNTNSSILLRGIEGDTAALYQVLLGLFQMIGEILTVAMLGLYLLLTDWFVALCSLALAGVCLLGVVLGFKGKIKRAGVLRRDADAEKSQCSYQAINGIKEITVMDRRSHFTTHYEEAADKTAKTLRTYSFLANCPTRIIEGICVGGFVGVICIRLALGVDMSTFIPVLGAFVMGAFKILPSISKISGRLNDIIFYRPGLENCYEIIREARAIDRKDAERAEAFQKTVNTEQTIAFRQELVLRDVCWHYQNAKEEVLKHLSMTIKKGEAVALIGSSGAGKTTLSDIIMGLLQPQEGEVLMDGIDIFSCPHAWSRIIGYVPQSVFLIDDTIRANVAFGIPRKEVEDEKIWQALRMAQIESFVKSLPEQLDTIVGERGVKFSGGQRQRVAIARALYENPDILVLDEATSALDTETESAVMESIDALQGIKTLIIVAHRLTTIRNCDRIYQIEDGVAVEKKKEDVL